jgi:hypothetical protein
MKWFKAVSMVAATLVGLAMLSGLPGASSQTPPPVLEVQGVQIGMTADQAAAALNSQRYTRAVFNGPANGITRINLGGFTEAAFNSTIVRLRGDNAPNATGDVFWAGLLGPGSPNTVYAISRTSNYALGDATAPSAQSVSEGLTAKYGAPSWQMHPNGGAPPQGRGRVSHYLWAWGVDGRLVTGQAGAICQSGAVNSGMLQIGNGPDNPAVMPPEPFPQLRAAGCMKAYYVKLRHVDGILVQLEAYMVDAHSAYNGWVASGNLLRRLTEARNASALGRANTNRPDL